MSTILQSYVTTTNQYYDHVITTESILQSYDIYKINFTNHGNLQWNRMMQFLFNNLFFNWCHIKLTMHSLPEFSTMLPILFVFRGMNFI